MLEIRLRPQLLAYRDTITLDGLVLILDIEYHARTSDWWISFYAEDGSPILEGRRVVGAWPLTAGALDPRLPTGGLLVLPVGDRRAVAGVVPSRPGPGELGTSWRLVFYDLADLADFAPDVDLLEPASIREVES